MKGKYFLQLQDPAADEERSPRIIDFDRNLSLVLDKDGDIVLEGMVASDDTYMRVLRTAVLAQEGVNPGRKFSLALGAFMHDFYRASIEPGIIHARPWFKTKRLTPIEEMEVDELYRLMGTQDAVIDSRNLMARWAMHRTGAYK
jgi:hypothetical protein